MGGIWGALTWQGKTLVVSVVLLALLILGLVSRRGPTPTATTQQSPAGQAVTIIGQPLTAGAQQPGVTTQFPAGASAPTVAVSPTAPATATNVPATSTPVPTERLAATAIPRPTSPPPPPTAVPIACLVAASLANPNPLNGSAETVSAKLTCNGAGVAGAVFKAVVHYPSASAACGGVSDPGGSASCVFVTATAPSGSSVSIDACLTRREGDVYCGQTGYTAP